MSQEMMPTITVYGRDGKMRTVILGARGQAIRNIRRCLTAIEMELEGDPDEIAIAFHLEKISDFLTEIWCSNDSNERIEKIE